MLQTVLLKTGNFVLSLRLGTVEANDAVAVVVCRATIRFLPLNEIRLMSAAKLISQLFTLPTNGAAMFAPKVARAPTKATASSTNSLANQRSTLVAHRPGHRPVEQALMLQRTIGNQAMLRLLAHRAGSLTWNESSDQHEQGAEGLARKAAPLASWDFSKIPVFPPDQPNRPQAPSPLAQPPLPGAVHTKLVIGRVDDPLEHEADHIADQVMRTPGPEMCVAAASPQLSRKCAICEQEEEATTLQAKPAATSAAAGSEAPAVVHEVLHLPGQPLDPHIREFFESRFGRNFGDVRIHTGNRANESARAVNAFAYTLDHHVVFANGKYAPASRRGRRLLAHELVHVLQQSTGSQSVIQRSVTECAEELANPPDLTLIAGGGIAIHELIRNDFKSKTGASDVVIPGASAAPLRTGGLCGKPSSVIPPQKVGGKAGAGIPDLAMQTGAGILLVGEIKPAVIPCLIDGESQVLGYIDAGNATDPQQVAWRAGLGVTVVSPMLEKHYPPTSFSVGIADVETTWCNPGLLAYTVHRRGVKVPVPVPVPVQKPTTEDQKKTLRERLPSVPEWVWAAIGATAAALIIACFATGVCEVGAIVAAVGEGIGWIIVAAMRLAGVGLLAQAAEAAPSSDNDGASTVA
jgi:hypothetical protein